MLDGQRIFAAYMLFTKGRRAIWYNEDTDFYLFVKSVLVFLQ